METTILGNKYEFIPGEGNLYFVLLNWKWEGVVLEKSKIFDSLPKAEQFIDENPCDKYEFYEVLQCKIN